MAAVRPQLPLPVKLIDDNGMITKAWSFYFTGVDNQLGTPGSVPVYTFNGRTGNIILNYADVTGALLFVPVNANAAVITGGSIDGTTIGSTNATTGQFTTVHLSGPLTSTASTGIAPLVINSATPVVGLNTTGNADTATLASTANVAITTQGLSTSSGVVVINGAVPPVTGQVLVATSTTSANWQTPAGGGGGGATGGGTDQIFFENQQIVTTNYTIPTNWNAVSAGPITIAANVTVTIPTGSVWSIV